MTEYERMSYAYLGFILTDCQVCVLATRIFG